MLGSLSANIRELLGSISNPLHADKETVATLRHDLAFLEGNVRAYREVIAALKGLKKSIQIEAGPIGSSEPQDPPHDCGPRAAQ